MKKIFYLILIFVMVFALSSCGSNNESGNSGNTETVIEDNNSDSENDSSETNDDTLAEDDDTENSEDSSEANDLDNSALTVEELGIQSNEYYNSLDNFEIGQDIYSGIIIYSDLTAEPVVYATINSVNSTVFLNPFKFICNVHYQYFDGGANNGLDGIVVNNINIDQYGQSSGNTFDIYEKYNGVWNNINILQEEFVKNNNIGANYLTNFNYYFKNGQIIGENSYASADVIIAEYELTDEFAEHLYANYGFVNFVKSEDTDSIREEILLAMADSRATVYFDKGSKKIMYIEITNPGIVEQLRNIVALNHMDDLSDETYLALLKSFQTLKIKSVIKLGATNTDDVYELPEEALK